MPLSLVPKSPPSEKQAVTERVKKLPNLYNAPQCPRCGCRTSITAKNNGTVIAQNVCAECWKQGVDSPMQRTLKQV